MGTVRERERERTVYFCKRELNNNLKCKLTHFGVKPTLIWTTKTWVHLGFLWNCCFWMQNVFFFVFHSFMKLLCIFSSESKWVRESFVFSLFLLHWVARFIFIFCFLFFYVILIRCLHLFFLVWWFCLFYCEVQV